MRVFLFLSRVSLCSRYEFPLLCLRRSVRRVWLTQSKGSVSVFNDISRLTIRRRHAPHPPNHPSDHRPPHLGARDARKMLKVARAVVATFGYGQRSGRPFERRVSRRVVFYPFKRQFLSNRRSNEEGPGRKRISVQRFRWTNGKCRQNEFWSDMRLPPRVLYLSACISHKQQMFFIRPR